MYLGEILFEYHRGSGIIKKVLFLFKGNRVAPFLLREKVKRNNIVRIAGVLEIVAKFHF